MIEARDIHKYYINGKEKLHVLKGVTLKISPGEIVAIVGPSGAGKSTLLHILGGLDKPAKGEVFFEEKSLKHLSDAQVSGIRNKAIGFVFQFYHLLPEFNVLENVMLPALISRAPSLSPSAAKAHAEELLGEVGLKNRINHVPAQLSGGEQQRVALARALINEPKLLLCDEPTGNLDSETGKQICHLLKGLNQEKHMTLVIVTHNLEVAGLASKVYTIIDGRLQLKAS